MIYKQPDSFILIRVLNGFASWEPMPIASRASANRYASSWIVAVCLFGFALAAYGGEKIQITGGTDKIEMPGKVLSDDLFSKPLDFLRSKGGDGGGSLIPALPAPIQPTNLRKDQFEKKNWLLNVPETQDQDAALKQILGVREYDFDGSQKKSKTNRSYEDLWGGSSARKAKTPSDRLLEDPQARKEMGRDRFERPTDPLSRLNGRDRLSRSDSSYDEEDSAANGPIAELNLNNLLHPGQTVDPFSRISAGMVRPPGESSGLGKLLNQASIGQAPRSREQELRAQEFEKLLKGLRPDAKPASDPVISQPDITRQEINPIRGGRIEDYSGLSGSALATDSLPGLGKTSRPGLFDSLNTKVLGASSLSPAVVTPAPLPISQPKPPVLEIPKRKF